MNQIKTVLLICLGGLAVFWIIGLTYKVTKHAKWLKRLVWPYFIHDAWRFYKGDETKHFRWNWAASMVMLAIIAGIVVSSEIAKTFPNHFTGYQISLTFTTWKIWLAWCQHGYHNAALWTVRAATVITTLNLFTKLFMSWEDCSAEILSAFRVANFLKPGAGKIELQAPYTYVLKAAELFNIDMVFKQRDGLQRKSGVFLIGIGNAPPSGVVIMASRKGLPKNIRLGDLPKAQSRLRCAIGLSPSPVWWDWRKKRHTGIAGNTGDGKSNIARCLCASTNLADPDVINILVDIDGIDWQLPQLRNVIHVTDIDTLQRVMNLVEAERLKRVRLCTQKNTNHQGVTDVLELEDAKQWTNPVKVTRIYIYFDEFDVTFDIYGKQKNFQRAFELYSSFVKRGRKYGISTIAITTRPDFETFKSARDQFRWIGIGNFRARAGSMIFEEDIRGWNEIGSFRYELESPYEGLGVAMAPEVPLAGADDSLSNILKHTSAKAAEAVLKLGDWFNTQLYRIQHYEELEKVHESLEKYLTGQR